MEHPIIQIKNAITALLKGIDPDTDVFYEEIKGTEEKHGLDEPETYYFVDIIPNGNETVDRFFTDMGVLVDIAYHEKSESNTAYLIKGAEIDAVVRPVFGFGDRNITINDANMKVSDHTLCRGGCRRNREFDVAKGEYANYYCESYRFFFEQCLEKMIHIVETIKR